MRYVTSGCVCVKGKASPAESQKGDDFSLVLFLFWLSTEDTCITISCVQRRKFKVLKYLRHFWLQRHITRSCHCNNRIFRFIVSCTIMEKAVASVNMLYSSIHVHTGTLKYIPFPDIGSSPAFTLIKSSSTVLFYYHLFLSLLLLSFSSAIPFLLSFQSLIRFTLCSFRLPHLY